MTYQIFREIQVSVKLNDNQLGAVKKGTPGYDPSARYRMIYDVLVANTNCLTFKAADDLCADEGTWPTQCRGEAVTRIQGKSCTMGGQTTIVADVGYFRVRAAIHRHNYHPKSEDPRIGGAKGPLELKSIIDTLQPMVKESPNPKKHRQIFDNPPHITSDNFYLNEGVLHYAGECGFGLLGTCRRDRLPKGVPK